jgi:hypothetical protein
MIATVHVGFLCFALEKQHTFRNVLAGSLISFLLALTSGGFNESFTLPGDLYFYLLMAGVIGFALALTFMLISPGASNRQALFPAPPGIPTLLSTTAVSYWNYVLVILSSPERISAIAGLLFARNLAIVPIPSAFRLCNVTIPGLAHFHHTDLSTGHQFRSSRIAPGSNSG